MAEQQEQTSGREKPKMRPIEVYDNLNGFIGWDYSSYPMSKAEADVCIEALRVLMELDRIKEGNNERIAGSNSQARDRGALQGWS